MNKNKQRIPISTREVLEDINSSAEFSEGKERGEPLTLTFGRAAHALALLETQDSGNRTREGDRLNVAGYVDQFISAQDELDAAYTRGVSGESVRDIKRKVIPFNHAVKELIDNDPMAGFNEVNRFILEVYTTTHRGDLRKLTDDARTERLDTIRRQTLQVLSGMRHEIAAQQLFGHLGYEVDAEVSTEDELHGIDMTLTDADNLQYAVDIKGNQRDAMEARAKDRRGRRLIIWSTVPSEDFDGHFRLSPDVVSLRAQDIEHELIDELRRTGR